MLFFLLWHAPLEVPSNQPWWWWSIICDEAYKADIISFSCVWKKTRYAIDCCKRTQTIVRWFRECVHEIFEVASACCPSYYVYNLYIIQKDTYQTTAIEGYNTLVMHLISWYNDIRDACNNSSGLRDPHTDIQNFVCIILYICMLYLRLRHKVSPSVCLRQVL